MELTTIAYPIWEMAIQAHTRSTSQNSTANDCRDKNLKRLSVQSTLCGHSSRPLTAATREPMNPKDYLALVASLILAGATSADALAQNVPPIAVELGATLGGRLNENAARRPTNHAFACYALNTKPGEEVSIRVQSPAFDPVLEVARGALCTAASLQFENDNVDETSKDAQVSFRAAGGRYLIIIRGNSPASSGPFRLHLKPGLAAASQTQTSVTDEAERRRQIMAMEIEKRNAEIAAAEAKRKAELAAAEAQRLAWLAQEQEAQRYDRYEDDYEEDYEEDYEPAPTRNFMDVFANTLVSELEANQRQEAEFQRGIEQAVRRGEAEYQRRMAAERAQQTQQRQDQAMRQADAQRAQAAEAQRQAAARAQAAAEASRRLAFAQEQRAAPAQRNSDRIVAYPAGAQSSTGFSSQPNRASTRNDPATCVSGPELVKNPNCPNGAGARVTNQCAHSIDARVCHWTTRDRWDCGITSVNPGKTGGYPSCYGTGRMWMQVQYSDSRTKFADPP